MGERPNLTIPRFMATTDLQERPLPVIESQYRGYAGPAWVQRNTGSLTFDADRSHAKSKVAIDIVCNDKAELVDLPWQKLTGWNAAAKNTWDEIAEIDPNIRPFALLAHRERRLI